MLCQEQPGFLFLDRSGFLLARTFKGFPYLISGTVAAEYVILIVSETKWRYITIDKARKNICIKGKKQTVLCIHNINNLGRTIRRMNLLMWPDLCFARSDFCGFSSVCTGFK